MQCFGMQLLKSRQGVRVDGRMETCTFTQIVQLSAASAVGEAFYIHAHIIPDATSIKPFDWFSERENQELLALVYDVVSETEPTCSSKSSSKFPDYHIRRSRNLRALLTFSPVQQQSRQHLVIPEHLEEFSGLVPRVAFTSERGRKVLPFLNQRTKSSGYRAFRIRSSSLDVYVDHYLVTDNRGIFKYLRKLYPHQPVNPDIITYFQSFARPPAVDNMCSLADIPTAALKAKQPTSKSNAKPKGKLVRKSRPVTRAKVQGNIHEMLNRATPTSTPSSENSMGLTVEAIEKFCDFGSQECVVQEEEQTVMSEKDENAQCSSLEVQCAAAPSSDHIDLDETPPLWSKLPSPSKPVKVLCRDPLTSDQSTMMEVSCLSNICTPDVSTDSDTMGSFESPIATCEMRNATSLECSKKGKQLFHGTTADSTDSVMVCPSPEKKEWVGQTRTGASLFLSPGSQKEGRGPTSTKTSLRLSQRKNEEGEARTGASLFLSPENRTSLCLGRRKKEEKEGKGASSNTSLRLSQRKVEASIDDASQFLSPGKKGRKRKEKEGSDASVCCSPEKRRKRGKEVPYDDAEELREGGIYSPRSCSPEMKGKGGGTTEEGTRESVDLFLCDSPERNKERVVSSSSLSYTPEMKKGKAGSQLTAEGRRWKSCESQETVGMSVTSSHDVVGNELQSTSSTDDEVVDLTGIDSAHSVTQSAQRRKKMKSGRDIVKGAERIADLSIQQLRKWMFIRKPLLVDIFKRSVYSHRHEDYVSGSHRKRAALRNRVDHGMFNEEQIEVVTKTLLHIFCGRHKKFFPYVMDVLLPECVIRIVADVHGIDFAKAEEMVMKYRPNVTTNI